MDYQVTAKKILERVGGKENVLNLVHCMTRLRFTLKDESIVDDEAVKRTKGVMGIMKKAGQYQIIIGNDVGNVYAELCKLGDFQQSGKEKQPPRQKNKQGIVATLMDTISGIMSPVIPAIIGAAMIKVLLTLLPMIGILDTSGQTYSILSVIGDGAFFFMPVLIAMSAAKKFGTNPYYAVSLALVMLHPNFISLMGTAQEASQTVQFLGFIPVTYASYAYSVIPIILAVWSLKYVERLVDKITPVVTKNFLKPMLVMLIAAPIALIVLGPLGAICGNLLSQVVYGVYDKLGFIAVGIIAGIYPFIVMAGMHHAFTPIKLGIIATTGYESFICIGELCSNMAQGAAAAAVAFKSKNKDFKQVAGSSAFSALVAGITEPALYGVTLRLKRPMLGACIGAVAGGLFGGFFQMKCFGIATPAIVTIVQYVEENRASSLLIAAAAIAITVVVTFVATLIIGFEDVVDDEEEEQETAADMADTGDTETRKIDSPREVKKIGSPLKGRVVPLDQVNDATFSQGILGKGAAVIPEDGEVTAPFDGTIRAFFETGHAIGLVDESGCEILIHVGLDTVNLEGKYFAPCKKTGDQVKRGELLLKFDLEKIREEGYDPVTPVIVTNSDDYIDVVAVKETRTERLETLFSVVS